MRRLKLSVGCFLIMLFATSITNAQKQQYCLNFPAFRNYIYGVVIDSTNYWSQYPKPPLVTDAILMEMQNEIVGDDSIWYYFDRLSFKKFKKAIDYESALGYINKKDYLYSLLVLAVHWNPDLRVTALVNLNKKLSIRPLINSSKGKNGEWERFDKLAVDYLIYILENTTLFISGSENATIHGIYLSNIIWNLDLLTRMNVSQHKSFSGFYKNDAEFKASLSKWKSYGK